MATISLIQQAIVSLADRSGSSVYAINKYLETEMSVSAHCVVILRGSGSASFWCLAQRTPTSSKFKGRYLDYYRTNSTKLGQHRSYSKCVM